MQWATAGLVALFLGGMVVPRTRLLVSLVAVAWVVGVGVLGLLREDWGRGAIDVGLGLVTLAVVLVAAARQRRTTRARRPRRARTDPATATATASS